MQVVYAGGSSTPSPSPRLQRKNYASGGGYGRPVMPGYLMGHPHQPSVLPHNHQRPSREKLTEGDASLRDSIPAMSKPVAVTCLVLNVVLPGMGTFVSGLTVMCGSQVRPKGASRRSVVWTNSGVALVQFFLTFLFLLGWIWSIMWGTAFLSISKEYYKKSDIEEVSTQGRNSKHSPTPKREHNSDNNSSAHHHAANPSSSSASSSRNHNHDHSHVHGHAHAQPHAHHSSETHHHHHNHHQQRQPVRNGMSVNTVGGTLATNPPDIYINPSSSLPSCERIQPIIVLQAAPVHVNHSETPPAPSRALMNARTRHEKILQRQMSDNELSPFILTHQKLEAIVIHDAPIVQRPTRALPDVDESDPNFAPLPKS